jgi:hypothetical protein
VPNAGPLVPKCDVQQNFTPGQVTLRVHADLTSSLFSIGALSPAPSWEGVQPSAQVACEWKLKSATCNEIWEVNAEKCDVQRNLMRLLIGRSVS